MQFDLGKLPAAIAVERDEEKLFRVETAPNPPDTYLKQWDFRPTVLLREDLGPVRWGFGCWCGGSGGGPNIVVGY